MAGIFRDEPKTKGCPECPNLIFENDPHEVCFTCLTGQHDGSACEHCQALPASIYAAHIAIINEALSSDGTLPDNYLGRLQAVEISVWAPPLIAIRRRLSSRGSPPEKNV